MVKGNRSTDERLQSIGFDLQDVEMQPEMEVVRAIVEARKRANLTQAELARRTGIDQGDISKLENGIRNPSLKLLKRLAKGMDMRLEIHFIDRSEEGTGAA